MRHKNQTDEFIKECICLSYINLLLVKPKEEISITEICQKSGFGRTTYYRHFGTSKNDLIIYIANVRWMQYKEQHKEEVAIDTPTQFLAHLYEIKHVMLMLKRQNLVELMYVILCDIFGSKDLEDRAKKYAIDSIVGIYFAVIYDWICFGCIETPEEIREMIQDNVKELVLANKYGN